MNDTKSKIHSPKDVEILKCILKDMGISDYEPRVITQLLEFTYKYVTGILEDARVYSSHAKKKQLDLEDVKLAVQLQLDKTFTTPPPRDLLLEIARSRNSVALPAMKPNAGLRLPPDRYCLTSTNYKLMPPRRQFISRAGFRPAGATIMRGRGMVSPQVRVGLANRLVQPQPAANKLLVATNAPGEGATFQAIPDSDTYIKVEPGIGVKRKREDDYVGPL